MRKFVLMAVIMLMTVFSANAQTAIETPKFTDNVYITVNGGVTTPMSFEQVFPLNAMGGIAVGKWFNPVFGAEIEGSALFGSHENGKPFTHFDNEVSHNIVRGHYVGVNGLVNFSNLFGGYKGTPRLFEVNLMAGTGWLHIYNPSSQADDFNGLGVKTGLDLAFNLGKAKAHTLSIRPAVLWNVNTPGGLNAGDADMYMTFNRNHAQLYLGVAYTYHFKTSNKTHNFKVYDVGAMQSEIARLNDELAKKPKEVVVEKVVERVVKVDPVTPIPDAVQVPTVFFAFDSAELDDRAKEELDKIGENGVYCVDGYASSEGSTEYNLALSQRRADAVKEYLEARGCKIESAVGHGVQFGATTGRVVIVTAK